MTLSLSAVPAPARWLGLAGLIPFAGLALAVWLLPQPGAARAAAFGLLAYGAAIASFLGAVHWGVAFARPGSGGHADGAAVFGLAWGVTPAIVAWALLFVDALAAPEGGGGGSAPALAGMLALLIACWAVDESRSEPAWWRPRYLPLRRVLTLGAGTSLGLGAAGMAWG